MKIEIKGDDEEKLTISNEDLNVENFVTIRIMNDVDGAETTIPLDELLSAVSSFIQLRNQIWKRETEYNQRFKFIK